MNNTHTYLQADLLSQIFNNMDIRERVGLLANHPYMEISTHASILDDLLENFQELFLNYF
jgi:hypothetical protein